MTRTLHIGFCLAALLTGCTRQIMTPPTRVVQGETPRVLEASQKTASLSFGEQSGSLYVNALTGSAQLRMGMGGNFEGSLGLNWNRVMNEFELANRLDPNLWSLHVGGKYNPPGWEKFFAWVGGAGAGISEAGNFAGLEAGFTSGWENPHVVPYFGAKGMVNIPLSPKPVNLDEPGVDPNSPYHMIDTAQTTYGAMGSLGVKVPLGSLTGRMGKGPFLFTEATLSYFGDQENDFGFLGLQGGLEFPLPF